MSPVDYIAAVFLVGGAALMALGAMGLLRFPDVLTRMHSATKAATVGVIGVTVAAALEAGAAAGVLVLVLVIALLFLSGPLGMSLLARAAYHDPETFCAPTTHYLVPGLPEPRESLPPSLSRTSWLLAAWLLAAWIALFGSVAPNVLVGGVAAAAIVAFAFRHLAPRWPRALAHPLAAARFAGFFTAQLLASTWGVIMALRLRSHELRPAVIEVLLRVRSRTELTLLMNAISFTPGTVALELNDGVLFVHVLDTDEPAAVVADIERLESHIMDMFGSQTVRSD